MNFDYSDDQKFLKAEARKLLAAKSPPACARRILDDPATGFDRGLWDTLAAQGWIGLSIPEHHGGQGLGYVELCAIAEELGRAIAPLPFASTVYFFTEALLLAADDATQADLLPRIARGDLIGTIAVTEAPGRLLAGPLGARVSDGRLSGIKLAVTDGMIADQAVVLAQGDAGPGLYLVDLTDDTVRRSALETLDPSRGSARILFDATPARLLGAGGDGRRLVETLFDRAAVLLAFEQLGGADRCLELARDYALDRFAFGRPIGSYQAVKHKLADIYVKNELARSNAYFGAWALDSAAPELTVAASAARIAACDSYWFAAKETIQVHGGIGFTWEMDCHLYYRRAMQLGLEAGAPHDWKQRLAAALSARHSNGADHGL